MSGYRPLFATSTARSGSYLVAMMLSANADVMLASEPFLELFRSLRNALVRHRVPSLAASFDSRAPIQDYYFSAASIEVMDAIQAGDLDTPYDMAEWDHFLEVSKARVELQCAELTPHMHRLRGSTYKAMFDNALQMIADVRGAGDRRCVGIKDAWTIEFFTPLARAYPEARFLVILRDPRAIINSMLGVVRVDPLQVAHVLSFARHWRKYVAFVEHYRQDPLFAGRLYVLRHEDVLREPETFARDMCRFLEVEYDPVMLDTARYFDYSTGATWIGNSSFEEKTAGISVHRGERWRTMLTPEIVRTIEFVAGPDMRLAGYEPGTDAATAWFDPDALAYVIRSDSEYANWRTDFRDPQQDIGFELFRKALLALPSKTVDLSMIRRSFLFEPAFARLRTMRREGPVEVNMSPRRTNP